MSAPNLGNFRSWQISRDQLCVTIFLGHLHMERSLGLHWDLQPSPVGRILHQKFQVLLAVRVSEAGLGEAQGCPAAF